MEKKTTEEDSISKWLDELDERTGRVDFGDPESVAGLNNFFMRQAARQAGRANKDLMSSLKGYQDLIENNLRIQTYINVGKAVKEAQARLDELEKEVDESQPIIEDLQRRLSQYEAAQESEKLMKIPVAAPVDEISEEDRVEVVDEKVLKDGKWVMIN